MKTNFAMIAIFAVLALFAVSFASANLATVNEVKFNGDVIETTSGEFQAYAGDVVPVRVKFTANDNASDVTVTVELDGYDVESSEFDIIDGKTYTKTFNVEVPADADDYKKDYTMYVTIDAEGNNEVRQAYEITIVREDHTFEVLSVDYNTRVAEGDVFPVSVVVENTGSNEAENVYVIASIPELGISTRGYVGDLFPHDNYNDDHEEDSAQETVLLQIPAEATTGIYDLIVEVYNKDASVKTSSLISVTGSAVVEEADDAVASETEGVSTSIIALTVVLVIIFVVLLAVLVVLVTRKDKEIEEAETSYY